MAGVVGLVGAAGLISVSVLGPRTMGSRDAPVHVLAVDRLVQEHPVGRLVRGEGTLVHGSVEHTSNVTTFVLESRGVVLPIRHASVVLPDTFRDAPGVVLDVMVEGELEVDGTFTAFSVLAKAPSGSRYLQTRAIRAVTHDSERELLRPVAVGAVVDE
ncbi:MAG TPA: cytochrome c maturation protein CcmE [Labilithrix sp.]|nr:cytochrome c maturation protein CcmE [Labilithrix sp.]